MTKAPTTKIASPVPAIKKTKMNKNTFIKNAPVTDANTQ